MVLAHAIVSIASGEKVDGPLFTEWVTQSMEHGGAYRFGSVTVRLKTMGLDDGAVVTFWIGNKRDT